MTNTWHVVVASGRLYSELDDRGMCRTLRNADKARIGKAVRWEYLGTVLRRRGISR